MYSGTGNEAGAYFTITSGDTTVDHIRFQVKNTDQTQILSEFLVPVNYFFAAHSISNVIITPSSPEGLLNGEYVNVSFSYYTTEAGGVLIFPRPFTNGNTTPNYGASGSPVYPVGSGAGTGSFTITTGMVDVDSIRFEMVNTAQTTVLLDYFVPVNFFFSSAKMSNIAFHPTSPAYFTNNEFDTASFAYTHSVTGGATMWVIPITNGSWSPNWSFQGSAVIPVGSGNLTRTFTITAGSEKVDAARFLMQNSTLADTYVSWDVPVNFLFGSQGLTGVKDPVENPTRFALEQNYPNPFNPTTAIRYQLPAASNVRLVVYDMLGREVSVLVDGRGEAGVHQVTFDGSGLSSGVYFYRMQVRPLESAVGRDSKSGAGLYVETKKLLLVR